MTTSRERALLACSGLAVALASAQPAAADAVRDWSLVAAAVAAQAPTPDAGTPAERQPYFWGDVAAVHVAIHDAVVAIDGGSTPFTSAFPEPRPDASRDAAIASAAAGVLEGLFPSRSAAARKAYDEALAAIPEGEAKRRGVEIGVATARSALAARARDGRPVTVRSEVGTKPGEFRGANSVLAFAAGLRPFAIPRAKPFLPPAPPPLASAAYARDYAEVKAFGGAESALRSPAQLEAARFHTEPPFPFWSRNFASLATGSPAENARLLAQLYVTEADAALVCFAAKMQFFAWRPESAIPLAGEDGNAATVPDPAWKPALPTPNHPEYPAAHGCLVGGLKGVLAAVGRAREPLAFDSTVTGTTRRYADADALVREIADARVHGGMHFRTATQRGTQLGERVAAWIAKRHFRTDGASPSLPR